MAVGQLDGMLKRDAGFLKEMWSWFAIGAFVIFLRFFVRLRMVGSRGLKGDDYTMLVTLILYTVCFVMVDLVYRYGSNVDLTPAQISVLSDEEVARLVAGSKFQQVAWYSYTAYLWSLKATLLFFYKRLTFDLWQNAKILKYLTWFTILSYLAVVGTITFSCLPFSYNWGVRPLPSEKCVFKAQNLLVTTFFNVVTDAAILSLPLPVLKEIRVPLYKKIFIAVLICSGLFVIAAAIMRVAVTLGSEPSTITVNRWGVRECEVGLMAINAPILRPLFSRRFWQWHYRPPARTPDPMESAKRSKATVARQRRVLKDNSLLGWMSSTVSRLGTVVRTRGRGSPVDPELGDAANDQELEPLNDTTGEQEGESSKNVPDDQKDRED
ncbi:cation diffusion facilitator 1 protein [Colletotrichum tofieldiae]|uniref:Cation diffusion facilitator 1 protein n=1 Tax=Colletotrichum tofieldiae TaxID=708197 RepID=A0A166YR48_9PEZI|nr:cation diffusion facilitator 1 protein [Colletotrichum tofieldiae]